MQTRMHIKDWKNTTLLIVGTGCMAVAIQNIYDPLGMVTGGFTGIGIMIRRLVDIPLWVTNLILNIPVFSVAFRKKGMRFVRRTAFAAVLLSLWLLLLPIYDFTGGDYFLATIYGGILSGIGIGMVLVTGNATGGTDLMATLLHDYFPKYSIVWYLLLLDGGILVAGFFAIGSRPTLYALMTAVIVTKVSKRLMEYFLD